MKETRPHLLLEIRVPVELLAAIERHLGGLVDTRGNALVYRRLGRRGERYPEWVQALKGQSGVYVIRHEGHIVYVGESHSGRLYEAMTRHFQRWKRRNQALGLVYDRESVEVATRIVPPRSAIAEESRLIRRLEPRDNVVRRPAEAL